MIQSEGLVGLNSRPFAVFIAELKAKKLAMRKIITKKIFKYPETGGLKNLGTINPKMIAAIWI